MDLSWRSTGRRSRGIDVLQVEAIRPAVLFEPPVDIILVANYLLRVNTAGIENFDMRQLNYVDNNPGIA